MMNVIHMMIAQYLEMEDQQIKHRLHLKNDCCCSEILISNNKLSPVLQTVKQ